MDLKAVHILAFLVAFQFMCYLFTADILFSNDEGQMLTAGWLLSKGEIIYRDFYLTPYLPGVPLIAAFQFTLFGPEIYSAKIALAASGVLTLLLVFFVSKSLYGETEALVASTAFSVLLPSFGGLFFLAEPFFAPLMLALFCTLHAYDKREGERLRWLVLSGIICSLLVILKLSGILILFASFVFILLKRAFGKEKESPLADSFLLFVGFALPLAFLALAFILLGNATQAYEQVIFFTLFLWKETLIKQFVSVVPYLAIVFIPIAFIPTAYRGWKDNKREGVLLLLLTAAALYAILMRFEPHRVLPALPLACVMIGPLAKGYLKIRSLRITVSILILVLMLSTLTSFVLIDRSVPEYVRYALSSTGPKDKVLFLPFGTSAYFVAKREPATRYLGFGPWGQFNDTEENAIRDISKNKPKAIVYSKLPQWDLNFSEYEPTLDKYIWEHYGIDRETDSFYFLVPK